jgi:hypothetical protein
VKLAVTDESTDIVTEHVVLVPLHEPDQPENEEPEAGVAVRLKTAPVVVDVEQVDPQLMELSEEVTVPEPEPVRVAERVGLEAVMGVPVTVKVVKCGTVNDRAYLLAAVGITVMKHCEQTDEPCCMVGSVKTML